jgi:hypothetical protein
MVSVHNRLLLRHGAGFVQDTTKVESAAIIGRCVVVCDQVSISANSIIAGKFVLRGNLHIDGKLVNESEARLFLSSEKQIEEYFLSLYCLRAGSHAQTELKSAKPYFTLPSFHDTFRLIPFIE